MTTSMRHELLHLLTRRRRQAMENAAQSIQQVHAMIKLVRQAANSAESTVRFSTDITEQLNRRLNNLRLQSYVALVDERARSRNQRHAILQAGLQQLDQLLHSRKQATERIQRESEALKDRATQKKSALIDEAEMKSASARSKARRSSREGAIGQAIGIGLGVGIALWVIIGWPGCIVMSVKRTDQETIRTFLWSLFLIPSCFGLFIGAVMFLWALGINQNRNQELADIDWDLQQDLSELKRKLSSNLQSLENQLASAKALEDKARSAVDWLNRQTIN